MANSFGSSANTAEIHVYEGTNGQVSTMVDVLNRILTDGHARVLNMSWGGAEIYEAPRPVMDSYHAVFNQMSGQGWTLVAASGDGGATADCADHLSVSYPASDPDVTAAGGTTLEGGEDGYTYRDWLERRVLDVARTMTAAAEAAAARTIQLPVTRAVRRVAQTAAACPTWPSMRTE